MSRLHRIDASACYLCASVSHAIRKGAVRDAIGLPIRECEQCGLVSLASNSHIDAEFYQQSGMHGTDPLPMETWLAETRWDDTRRFKLLEASLPSKSVLDFGCGAGGFLQRALSLTQVVTGIELETRVQEYWASQLTILPNLETAESASKRYEIITAFHVIEHLPDPRSILKRLSALLKAGGRIIAEVPSAQDALLTLYDCDAFQRFTYWSQHLFLFTASTLEQLAKQAGLKVISIQYYQRYPLSNHLHWLSRGQPGGHQKWAFLESPTLNEAYASSLAALGRTDTLIAHLECAE